jgi:protoporphyrinogen oxidase
MAEKTAIIGGGPAGLGAAYRLQESGDGDFRVYEQNAHLGGLSASFTDSAGFTWDIGGHVLFSHYPAFDRVFQELMGSEFQRNNRECWIRMRGAWVPYPFQYNIRHLPRDLCCECLVGLVKARAGGSAAAADNCADFMRRAFGEGIFRHFMQPYNFKVWAHPLEMMGKGWIGERVAEVDLEKSIRNILLEQDEAGWGPNNRFQFPLSGGTGEFFRRFAGPLAGRLSLGRRLVAANLETRRLTFEDGLTVGYRRLVTTIPLDRFIRLVTSEVPRDVRRAAEALRHSGGHMVGIGLRQPCPSTRSWMYFPESNCPFYRVTYLSNYSPHMTPDRHRHYSLLCETSYSDLKPVPALTIVEETIRGLVSTGLLAERDREDIVTAWHYDAGYSYPVPTLDRDQSLARIMPFLEAKDVFSRGRFGLWKYEAGNMDHSLMQGVELADRLLSGKEETTAGVASLALAAAAKTPVRLWSPRFGRRAQAVIGEGAAAEELGVSLPAGSR